MLKKVIIIFLLSSILLLNGCNQSSDSSVSTATNNVSTAASEVTIVSNDNIKQKPSFITAEEVIRKLASGEFKGRLTGTDENNKAAQYISYIFSKIGLEKYNNESYILSYIQDEFPERLKQPQMKDKTIKAQHVIGIIPGKDHSKAVVLTAHYDHIGSDKSGNIISGAVDNASGIGALTDIAQILKDQKNVPEQDVLICALDGEEEGLQAATMLAEQLKNSYTSFYNIDFDCIGVKGDNNIVFAGDSAVSGKLIDEMGKHLLKTGIQSKVMDSYGQKYFNSEYSYLDDSNTAISYINASFANSLAFSFKGIKSVTFMQNVTHENPDPAFKNMMEKVQPKPYIVHSISDTVDKMDFKFIEKISDLVVKFIESSSGKMF